MPIEAEGIVMRIRLKYGVLGRGRTRRLYMYIRDKLGYNPDELFKPPLYYTCFNDKCIIHKGSGKYFRATKLYEDGWIGVIMDKHVYPSPIIYERIYHERGFRAAIIVGDRGVRAFLYGNDILPESIIREYPPLDSGVAVVDHSDHRVIGVALRVKHEGSYYYRNIYDLGMFLRVWG